MQADSVKVENGENTYGYGISEGYPYSETSIENTIVSRAVVSGTPQKLARYQQLDIVRASVLGVTIDKY